MKLSQQQKKYEILLVNTMVEQKNKVKNKVI